LRYNAILGAVFVAEERWIAAIAATELQNRGEPRVFGEELRNCAAFRGRLLGADGCEHPCQSAGVSSHYIAVRTPYSPTIGERVVIYFERWDRFAGTVARIVDGGFALLYEATERRREKVTALLDWVSSEPTRMNLVMREDQRIVPRHSASRLTFRGRTYECEIVDISRKGAAVRTLANIPLSARMEIGTGFKAEVVRKTSDGFSVQFLRFLPLDAFDENVRL
jgi:hypothetical protein